MSGAELADSVTITLRMDPRMLARIKRLARMRYLNYQSMIKQWLSERMEQEMREQKLGAPAQHGFTLIELLVVITIMALVAGMIVAGGQYASKVKKETAVKAERQKLQLMIDNYFRQKLNFYPPCNSESSSDWTRSKSPQNQ